VHIDERRLAELSEEVDDLHHESMTTIAEEFAEVHFGEVAAESRPARRDLLRRAVAGGALLTIGSVVAPLGRLMPAAWADLPPDDAELARFAAGIELAVVAVYGLAVESGKLSLANDSLGRLFSGHHRQHADALNEALGEENIVTAPEPVFLQRFAPDIDTAGDEAAVLEVAYTIEEVAAATYLFAIGKVGDADSAGTLATILPVESQHATVLATILDKDPRDYLVEFLTTDQAAKPADFPA